MRQFLSVLRLLSPRERWQMAGILAFMLPNALLQVLGVASVMPFIAVLAQPELVESNAMLSRLHQLFGAPPLREFLIAMAVLAIVLLLLSNALAAFTTWLMLRFSYLRTHTFSNRLLKNYLAQDYIFFLQRNPSELSKNVLNEVNQLVSGYLLPALQVIANAVIVLALLTMLIVVDPVLSLSVGLALGGAYGLIYVFFRRRLHRLGARRLEANARRFRTAHEAFGAIKDLKVGGGEETYLRRYHRASQEFATTQSVVQMIAQLPRFVLEVMAFGLILAVALFLFLRDPDQSTVLPMIALYAMAGHRLMPALQKMFDSAAMLRVSAPVVERMERELGSTRRGGRDTDERDSQGKVETLAHSLELDALCYRYPGTSAPVVSGVSLSIAAHTTVAFVGESGAGKSTLIDLILGLLTPTDGSLLVDGVRLDQTLLPAWRRHIGYVPQAIYLTDDTLRNNIALGVREDDIDDEAVVRAARAAAIHDFIVSELPKGYDTVAGDRGIRLSGGQRQRIGIARALYRNPPLLILDEATSALDGSTEHAVMGAIERLAGQKTIIMIAHRLTTVRGCDRIYLLDRGRVVASGTYEELLATQPLFQKMATTAASASIGGRLATASMEDE